MFKNKEASNDFVWSRVIEFEETALRDNEDYGIAIEKCAKILDEIKKLSPREVITLLVEYCDICTQAGSIAEYALYKQGFKDGARVQMLLSETEVR